MGEQLFERRIMKPKLVVKLAIMIFGLATLATQVQPAPALTLCRPSLYFAGQIQAPDLVGSNLDRIAILAMARMAQL